MPSIEIICVGQPKPTLFVDMPFAVESGTELVSHRSPAPLWQAEFNKMCGCIYHIGSPALREPQVIGAYTAFDLLSKDREDWWQVVHFSPEYASSIKALLDKLLIASPAGKIIFSSDYQFGPKEKRYKRPLRLMQFWQLHDEQRIRMNALYELKH